MHGLIAGGWFCWMVDVLVLDCWLLGLIAGLMVDWFEGWLDGPMRVVAYSIFEPMAETHCCVRYEPS